MPKSLSAIPVKGMMRVGRFEPKDVTMLRVSVGVECAVASVSVSNAVAEVGPCQPILMTWLRRYIEKGALMQAKFPGIPMPGDRMFPECTDVLEGSRGRQSGVGCV